MPCSIYSVNLSTVLALVLVVSISVNCFIHHFEQIYPKVNKLVVKYPVAQKQLDLPGFIEWQNATIEHFYAGFCTNWCISNTYQ